jgi:hypothetical protein
MKDSLAISKILTKALSCFQQMAQWSHSRNFDYVYQYQSQAEALIELVEVHDCGSIGGFSKGQQPNGNDGSMKYGNKFHSLYARWLFLAEKYGYNTKGISKAWEPEIKKFFTRKP